MVTARAEAPGPKGFWPFGHVVQFRRDPLALLTRVAREYGDVARFSAATQTVYFLNHPDHIKDVLVTHHARFMKGRALQRAKRLLGEGLLTSEGDFWRRQRRLAQPAFHRQRINSYAETMVAYAEQTSARWRDGETLDISGEMMRLTLAVVGKTLFDADVESDADEVGAALTEVMNLFGYLMLPFAELLEKLPLPPRRRFERARARLDAVMYRIIEEHRREGRDRGDLLSTLLQAVDEEGDRTGMTDEQLRDEAMTIFLAGHETTANALAWTWYLLSQNPEVEARLHEELEEVLAGRLPTAEDYPRLRYAEMVVAESMRLYPPAWAVGRLALEEHEVGGYLTRPRQPVRHAPRPALLAGARTLRPRALHAGGESGAASVCILPLWRRPASLRGRGLRLDGGRPHPRHARPPLAPAPRTRRRHRHRATHHAAPRQRRHPHESREP